MRIMSVRAFDPEFLRFCSGEFSVSLPVSLSVSVEVLVDLIDSLLLLGLSLRVLAVLDGRLGELGNADEFSASLSSSKILPFLLSSL